MDADITVTMEDGRPIEVLNRLIAIRSQQFQQTTKSATVAVLIDALKSIRAATLNAEKRKKFNIIVKDTGWYGGFSNTERKPVIRNGISPKSPKVTTNLKVKWCTNGIMHQRDKHVYLVTPESLNKKPYYIVASSAKVALNYEIRASLGRVKALGGLAKNALGVAMNKISNLNPPLDGSNLAKAKASMLGIVEEHDSGNDYSIAVTDELEYASDALKGGQSAVDLALMKAANKVYGMLKHQGQLDLEDDFGTPFPEVKQRK